MQPNVRARVLPLLLLRLSRGFTPLIFGLIIINAAPTSAIAEESMTVLYAQGDRAGIETSFPFQVLKLGLSKTGKPYVLRPAPIGRTNSQRTAEAMIADGPVDVQWIGASVSDDEKMLPVLFPIDMGLLGYRVFLIDGARQSEFSQIKTIEQLRTKVALQGSGWADVQVLRSAGLPVRTAPNYKNLFPMTVKGRADYFPRGAFEAYSEKRAFADSASGLAVEDSLVLYYPFSFIFYVKKTDRQLHDDLYRGLVAAFDDGSYKALFLTNPDVQSVLANAHLKTRRIIKIDNPFISADMKALDARFWYQP